MGYVRGLSPGGWGLTEATEARAEDRPATARRRFAARFLYTSALAAGTSGWAVDPAILEELEIAARFERVANSVGRDRARLR